jgi:hypothetical protein
MEKGGQKTFHVYGIVHTWAKRQKKSNGTFGKLKKMHCGTENGKEKRKF